MSAPSIGERFAFRERPDGSVLCIVRTDHRSYQFEWRDAERIWWRLLGHETSEAAALGRVDEIAAIPDQDARWQHMRRMMMPAR
jgi:hypothetical protein